MYYLNLTLFSLIVGLLGIFYRNILKEKNMILGPLFKVFDIMVNKGGFLKWLAYPLGYCIYCSTTWIAILGFLLVYRVIALEILIPIAISHIIVDIYCKYVLGDIYRKRLALAKELAEGVAAKKKQKFQPGCPTHEGPEEVVIPKPEYKSDSTRGGLGRSFTDREIETRKRTREARFKAEAEKRELNKKLIEAESELAALKFANLNGKIILDPAHSEDYSVVDPAHGKEAPGKRSPKIGTNHQDFVNSLPEECHFFSLEYLTEHYFPAFVSFIKHVREDNPESGDITKTQLLVYAIDADFNEHMEGAKI